MDTHILSWALTAGGFALAALGALELRRRREMVARACHELRGPLTAVRLSLATMERRQEAPPERLATLDHELRRAGLALDDFAAARSGRRIVDREEPVEVAELLEEQFHSWEAVAGAFDSVVVLGRLLPGAIVVGDRLRLAQAISNLIANALEHAPGRIELNARVVGAPARAHRGHRRGARPAGPARRADPARAGRPRARRTRAAGWRSRRRSPSAIADGSSRRRRRTGTRIGVELPLVRRAPP